MDHVYSMLFACMFVTSFSSRESWSAPLPFKVIWNSSASLTLTAVCFSSPESEEEEWRDGSGGVVNE